MGVKPSTLGKDYSLLVDQYINTAYDIVKIVADNLALVIAVGDSITAGDIDAAIAAAVSTNSDLLAVQVIYDNFDDRYLGDYANDPVLDNDGDALLIGAMYFNTTINEMKFYNGSTWNSPVDDASQSATIALAAQAAAELALDTFDDIFLGPKSAAPTLNNDGDALTEGVLYYDTTFKKLQVYDGAAWQDTVGAATLNVFQYTATTEQTVFSGNDDNVIPLSYTPGAILVGIDGAWLDPADYTAVDGTSITVSPVTLGAQVQIVAFGTFSVANVYLKSESDVRYPLVASDNTFEGTNTFNDTVTNKVGLDIASASNLVLGAGNYFDISGVTPITSIASIGVGTTIVLQFDDSLTLTHNSVSLVLPEGLNIQTAPGDIGVFYEYSAGNWRCISYLVANPEVIGIKWTSPRKIGPTLSIVTPGGAAIAALSPTEIVYIDYVNELLSFYRFNGETWLLVGATLSIPGMAGPALAALNATDVAFLDAALKELRLYRWGGAAWTLIGTGLSITPANSPALARLNSTDIAMIDPAGNELRTYRWGGASWSIVGNPLAVSIGTPALAALKSHEVDFVDTTDVVFVDDNNNELRTYRFDGTDWALLGVGSALPETVTDPDISALNATDIVLVDLLRSAFRIFRFKNLVWLQVGDTYKFSSAGLTALTTLNATDIVLHDSSTDELTVYRFGFAP